MKIINFSEEYNIKYPVGEYMTVAIEYINLVLPKIKEIIADKNINIWCRGSSGAILAALLVSKLDNNCIIFHIKKEGESSHHGNSHSKSKREALNIIIDDFISSGDTVNNIFEVAKNYITSINILVVSSINKRDDENKWRLKFIPNNLIIDKHSVNKEWESLEPTRVEKVEEEINLPF